MAWSVDARVPVRFGTAAEVDATDALLVEGEALAEAAGERFDVSIGHPAGCACCVERSAAATALDRLFQRRARGQIGFFRRVVVVTATAEGDLAVWTAIRDDPLVSARYRMED